MSTTVLVDYDSGNLHSAQKAFERMAAETGAGDVIVTSDPDVVSRADRVVLPGDGAFPACRAALFAKTGVAEAVIEAVEVKGQPFLGICVGMQMLARLGHEFEPTPGFGWIDGEVERLHPQPPELKIPHMGWNDLIIEDQHPILDGVEAGAHAYFVHSYAMRLHTPAERLAYVEYGGQVTAIVGKGNVVGTQFHPEKSQETGLRMIANFLKWAP